MTFLDIVKLAGAILAGIGGAGGIIFGLSGFLGKLWADRALEDHRQQYNQLNMRMQHDLDSASKRLQMELDTIALVHNIRTKEEFSRLAELWKRLANLEFALATISGPIQDLGQTYQEDWRKYRAKLIEDFENVAHDTQQFFYQETIFIPEVIAMVALHALSIPLRILGYLDTVQDLAPNADEFQKLVQRALEEFTLSRNELEQLIRTYVRGGCLGKTERPY